MQHNPLLRYVLIVLAILLTVVALYFGQRILLILIFPAIFAFVLLPITQRMEKWGFPRWLSSTLSTLLLVLLLGGLIAFIGTRVVSFKDKLPAHQERIDTKVEKVQGFVSNHLDVSYSEQIELMDQQLRAVSKEGGKLAIDTFSWTGEFLSNIVLIIIVLLLMLMYRKRFRQFLTEISKGHKVPVLDIVQKISSLTREYLKGMGLVILILAVLNSTGFLILGLDHAILLGISSALLTIIPFIGTFIGGLLPLAMAFLTKDSLMYPLAVFGIINLSQFLEGNFITPKVVGSSVSLNPLASILALAAGGMLWGVAGMVLAIPLMGMFKILCDAIPGLQPYGFLLGEKKDRKWLHKKKQVTNE